MGPRPEHVDAPYGGEDRRKQFRHEVRWWAQIEVGVQRSACCVFDLSQTGAKVRVAVPLVAQESVRLVISPFGAFESEFMWSQDGVVGIRFAEGEHHRVSKLISSALIELPT
jgi:hypothetical protein